MSILKRLRRDISTFNGNRVAFDNKRLLSYDDDKINVGAMSDDSGSGNGVVEKRWSFYEDKNVGVIRVYMDGSCFFHSILMAVDDTYFTSSEKDKKNIAYSYRHYLANLLESVNADGVRVYDTLSRGKLAEISEAVADVSLDSLKSLLRNIRASVGQEIIELVSNDINIDIYIVDVSGNYYVMGDKEIYYKNRASVVLLYNGAHYDLLVYKVGEGYRRVFRPDDEFIVKVKSLAESYF